MQPKRKRSRKARNGEHDDQQAVNEQADDISEKSMDVPNTDRLILSITNSSEHADKESEHVVSDTVDQTSMDDWEEWEECDFMSTENDSGDEWLP